MTSFTKQEGAFDKAVVGVDAVQHTASPFHFKADDPQGIHRPYMIGYPDGPPVNLVCLSSVLIEPALKGTVGILESIKKYAPGVKRVVITSSVAAIVHNKGREGVTYDEVRWLRSRLRCYLG